MLITPPTARPPNARPTAPTRRRRYWLAAALLVGYTGAVLGLLCLLNPAFVPLLRQLPGRIAGAGNALQRQLLPAQHAAPRLALRLDAEATAQLAADRERALQELFVDSSDNHWLPAEASWDETSGAARVRLKGVRRDHWARPDKWSLAVELAGDGRWFGLRRFSLQHPGTRAFELEWLFSRALADEGLLSPRVEFVEVQINGDSHGLYLLQETTDAALLERHQQRRGPIVAFDKGDWVSYWREHVRYQRLGHSNPAWFYQSAPVRLARTKRLSGEAAEADAQLQAVALLEAFRSGRLPAHDVFDIEAMANLAAVQAVLGGAEFDWKDLDFHYDPITAQLVPIGAELPYAPLVETNRWWRNGNTDDDDPFVAQLFADPEFTERYLGHLDRVSRPEWLAALLERHRTELAACQALLATEFTDHEFDPGELVAIANVIRNTLRPPRAATAHLVRADGDRLLVEIGNVHAFPLRVIGASLERVGRLRVLDPPTLPGKRLYEVVRTEPVWLELPDGTTLSGKWQTRLEVELMAPGLDAVFSAKATPWPADVRRYDVAPDPLRQPIPLDEFDWVTVDETRHEIRLLPGDWVLDRPLVLPSGHTVIGGANTRIDLRGGAFIVSHSAVRLAGSAEAPFVLYSSDGSGGGLAVLNAGEMSSLQHVVARDLSPPAHGRWQLTGAVTFYESPVRIEDCTFAANRAGDDLVNLFRSSFSLHRSELRDSLADALDVDFSDGVLSDVRFARCGNDALDTSGSTVEVRRVHVEGAGDKGMSFGERSRATVEDCTLLGARTGVASKDGSVVQLRSVRCSGGEFGLAVYRKKPEFDGGDLEATDVALDATVETIVERGSTLRIDGATLPGEQRSVADLMEAER